MTPDELETLRTRLRHAIQVDQWTVRRIAKGSGVWIPVLGEFLAGGPLDDQQALQLHSHLYYGEKEEKATILRVRERRRTAESGSRYARFKALHMELKREYGEAIKYDWNDRFVDQTVAEQRRVLMKLEQRCKTHLRKKYADLIYRHLLYLNDSKDYWLWKRVIDAAQVREAAWRHKPTRSGSSHNHLPEFGG